MLIKLISNRLFPIENSIFCRVNLPKSNEISFKIQIINLLGIIKIKLRIEQVGTFGIRFVSEVTRDFKSITTPQIKGKLKDR